MTVHQAAATLDRRFSAERLDTLAWALLLIWIGIVLLASLGWGIGLLGVGIILFSEQLVRVYSAANLQIFWIVAGAVLVIGGVSDLAGIQISLIPVAFIVAGVALLVSALFSKTAG